jgi:hypothetical protein
MGPLTGELPREELGRRSESVARTPSLSSLCIFTMYMYRTVYICDLRLEQIIMIRKV